MVRTALTYALVTAASDLVANARLQPYPRATTRGLGESVIEADWSGEFDTFEALRLIWSQCKENAERYPQGQFRCVAINRVNKARLTHGQQTSISFLCESRKAECPGSGSY